MTEPHAGGTQKNRQGFPSSNPRVDIGHLALSVWHCQEAIAKKLSLDLRMLYVVVTELAGEGMLLCKAEMEFLLFLYWGGE